MNETLNKLNRLKNGVNPNILNKLGTPVLWEYKFVPINVKDNCLFTAIGQEISDKDVITRKLREHFSHTVKFIELSDEEISEFITMVTHAQEAPVNATEATLSARTRLGDLLLASNHITQMQLMQALAESKRIQKPLGSTLVKLGYLTLDQLKSVLNMQTGYDMVTPELLEKQEQFIFLLPEEFIREHKVMPLSSDGKTLLLGVIEPLKPPILKEVIYLTGQNPKQLLMTHHEYDLALESFFSEAAKEKQAYQEQLDETHSIIQEIVAEASEDEDASNFLWEQIDNELQEAAGSVAKFVNKIITTAIDSKVSDVHIEPHLAHYIVRYRKDGMLQKVFDIPLKIESAIISRFKVLAKMNIAEHRRPQDGTFSIRYRDLSYDFRINSLPVAGKEKVVIRILAPAVSLSSNDRSISLVGATQEEIDKIENMVSCPNGIILTAGPTGSGKTTTLYSIMKTLNTESVNITTIEDPVEIRLEGINQSQVNPKAGITFASCMRAILRQDPDIILVGEIRDAETLEIAISAALTGHLVLSTVHTNSAAATVTRLIDMGAKDYLLASTLSGVIAQRLVRKLCDDCKEEYTPDEKEVLQITSDPDRIAKLTKAKLYRAAGCHKCRETGYSGRIGIFEILAITKEIKKLIAIGAHDLDIEEAAIASGMKTLHGECIDRIMEGNTSIAEFVRTLGKVNE